MCMTPIQVRNLAGDKVDVPCGKCPLCCARRISSWSFRLLQQDKVSTNSRFLTLTYDTDRVPITNSGYMDLCKRDVQLFFKKLRKSQELHGGICVSNRRYGVAESYPIKYFAVGEYGGKKFRPHYHIILFNALDELIQPAWNMGQVHYGRVSGASVGYTLKYMMKRGRIPMHRNDDRLPEFSLMSKGLGLSYLTEEMIAWHKADLEGRMYCALPDNKKIAMPRYFKEKIYNEYERIIAGKSQREQLLQRDAKERAAHAKKATVDYDTLRHIRVNAAFRKMEKSIKEHQTIF